MDVARDLLARQGTELLPAPAARLVQLADDREVPQLERGARRRSGGEDGEVPGDVLAGWDACGIRVCSATAPESARDVRPPLQVDLSRRHVGSPFRTRPRGRR